MRTFGSLVANNPTICICVLMVALWWGEYNLLYGVWDNLLSHIIFWLLITGQVLFVFFLILTVRRTKARA